MSELQHLISLTDKHTLFNGKQLHKKAFISKGTHLASHAAVIAGAAQGSMKTEDVTYIIQRMEMLRKGFRERIRHFVTSSWVDNAIQMGLKSSKMNLPIMSYGDMLDELDSNPRVSNFQNWYNICYRDTDVKSQGREIAEKKCMESMNIKYTDGTNSGGCVGELITDVHGKLMEQLQKRSKQKQNLHLVKSRPSRSLSIRRKLGDYYVVRSDHSTGRMIDFIQYNVRRMETIFGAFTFCIVVYPRIVQALTFFNCLVRISFLGTGHRRKWNAKRQDLQ